MVCTFPFIIYDLHQNRDSGGADAPQHPGHSTDIVVLTNLELQ